MRPNETDSHCEFHWAPTFRVLFGHDDRQFQNLRRINQSLRHFDDLRKAEDLIAKFLLKIAHEQAAVVLCQSADVSDGIHLGGLIGLSW